MQSPLTSWHSRVSHLKKRQWGTRPVQPASPMTKASTRFELLDPDEKRGLPVNACQRSAEIDGFDKVVVRGNMSEGVSVHASALAS